MRVALVHTQLAPGGGMERYLADIVRGFHASGDDVTVHARRIDADFARRLDVRSERIRVAPTLRAFRVAALSRSVQRLGLRGRYDLVISLARTRGQDVHVCGGTHPGYLEALGLPAGGRDRREIEAERGALADSRLVVAHARGLGDELRRHYGLADDKLRVIYPALDTQAFSPAGAQERAAARRRLGLEEGIHYSLFPSMGHERKGFDLVLAAFAQLEAQPFRLLVAGRDPGRPLPANARALGYVDDMRALYHAVDATVLPSRYEPFGLVLAESLECGTPVITSRIAGVAELMEGGDGIALASLTAEAVRDAVIRLKEERPEPKEGFARRHGLMLAEHVAALRNLAGAAHGPRPPGAT